MAHIVDQLIVVLELDSSKFKAGIEEAKAILQSLSGIIKVVAGDTSAMGKALQAAGADGATAGKKTAVGFDMMKRAVTAALAEVNKLKPAMASGQQGSIKMGAAATEAGAKVGEAGATGSMRLGGIISVASLVTSAIRQIIAEAVRLVDELDKMVGVKAMWEMGRAAGETANKIWRVADTLRVAKGDLQAWQDMTKMYGGTADGFNSSMEAMSAKIGTLGTQLRGAKTVSQLLGIEGLSEAQVKSKDALTILETIFTHAEKMTASQRLTVGKRFGLSEALQQMLSMADPRMIATLKELRKGVNTDAEAEGATDSELAWKALETQWGHTKMTLVSELQPALQTVAELLKDVTAWIRDNPDEARDIFYALAAAVTLVALSMSVLTVIAGILVAIVLGPLVALVYLIYKYFMLASGSTDEFSEKLRKVYNIAMPLLKVLSTMMGMGALTKGFTWGMDDPSKQKALDVTPEDRASERKRSMAVYNQMLHDTRNHGHGAKVGSKTATTSVLIHNLNVGSSAQDAAGQANDMANQVKSKFRTFGLVPQADGGVW